MMILPPSGEPSMKGMKRRPRSVLASSWQVIVPDGNGAAGRAAVVGDDEQAGDERDERKAAHGDAPLAVVDGVLGRAESPTPPVVLSIGLSAPRGPTADPGPGRTCGSP
jgi:hypothetical protein